MNRPSTGLATKGGCCVVQDDALYSQFNRDQTGSALGVSGGESRRLLHVGGPNIGSRDRFLELLNGALDAVWLTNDGPLVQELERRIAALAGVRECVLVCNGTVALEIAARSLELSGEVIVPSLTFIATASALSLLGLKPVFCDVDPRTYCLDPAHVADLITSSTSAILGVHLFGRPCDVQGLQRISDEHGIALFYDAAHAFGCSAQGRMIGGFGRCEVFSFHATKFFNTFEGGAIVTDDQALADRMRSTRNFGLVGPESVKYVGGNGKLTEVCAAMGIANLESLEEFIACNRRNYDAYRSELAGIPSVKLIEYDTAERQNYQYVVVELEPSARMSRDELMDHLRAQDVLARRYFWPGCHNADVYRSGGPYDLPVTESLCERLLALPTGSLVSPADVDRVVATIRKCLT